MKKILLSIIAMLSAFILIPVVNANEKVPVYMITKEGCSACAAALEYFDGLGKDYPDLFDLVELEVFDSEWNFVNSDLQSIFAKVYEAIGEDASRASTPTIVIGDFHSVGLPQDTSKIYDQIVKVSEQENRVDLVQDVAKTLNINIDLIRKDSTKKEENSNKSDIIIVVGIFAVLIAGFAGLVVISKK